MFYCRDYKKCTLILVGFFCFFFFKYNGISVFLFITSVIFTLDCNMLEASLVLLTTVHSQCAASGPQPCKPKSQNCSEVSDLQDKTKIMENMAVPLLSPFKLVDVLGNTPLISALFLSVCTIAKYLE